MVRLSAFLAFRSAFSRGGPGLLQRLAVGGEFLSFVGGERQVLGLFPEPGHGPGGFGDRSLRGVDGRVFVEELLRGLLAGALQAGGGPVAGGVERVLRFLKRRFVLCEAVKLFVGQAAGACPFLGLPGPFAGFEEGSACVLALPDEFGVSGVGGGPRADRRLREARGGPPDRLPGLGEVGGRFRALRQSVSVGPGMSVFGIGGCGRLRVVEFDPQAWAVAFLCAFSCLRFA